MLVRPGMIHAIGSGTRLGLFTNAVSRSIARGEKAVIVHVLVAMKLARIDEIVVVVSPHKHGLSDYHGSGKKSGVKALP